MKTKIEVMGLKVDISQPPFVLESTLNTLHQNGGKVISIIPRGYSQGLPGPHTFLESVWIVAEVKA